MFIVLFSSVSLGFLISYSKNILQLDAPLPWQIGFQDGASPGFEGIVTLHDFLCIRAKLREHPKALVTKETKKTLSLA